MWPPEAMIGATSSASPNTYCNSKLRAMPLAFPRDRLARSFELQYLFGDALLVAPIIAAGGTTDVYFPAGENWFDLKSGERIEGGQIRNVQRALDEAAIFGREGHVLCLGKAVMHTGEINLSAPIDAVHVFGLPKVVPCVMASAVSARLENASALLSGVSAAQCHLYGDVTISTDINGVLVRPKT